MNPGSDFDAPDTIKSSASSASNDSVALELLDINLSAGGKTLLDSVSVGFATGKISVIVGGSGAGKSLLLRIIAGLLPPVEGELSWHGDVKPSPPDSTNRVGVVFQQFALFDELSSAANVQFAIDHRSDKHTPPQQTAQKWLEELRVPSSPPVAALSGGQKQRLAIARTLASNPSVILYDEPTSGLDAASGRQVANLIRVTQQTHGRTSIVVTHDYETLIPIADHVYFLNSDSRSLEEIPRDQWPAIPDRMQPVKTGDEESPASANRPWADAPKQWVTDFFDHTGRALIATLRLPWDAIQIPASIKWWFRFLMHYIRTVAGPSAWCYMMMAGLIIGFASTFFTFRYLPFSLYTKPLLIEDLLASIGFALYRILVPVMATILIAARCGAAIAADVGVKRYGSQVDALTSFGIRPAAYLLSPIIVAFVLGVPALEWAGYQTARAVSLMTFLLSHSNISPHFWALHFDAQLIDRGHGLFHVGAGWVMLKNIASGVGIAAIAYHQGMQTKQSARDVSDSITSTVLWTTLFVLSVHFVVALFEF